MMSPIDRLQGLVYILRCRGGAVLRVFLVAVAVTACTEENSVPVGSPPLLETGADMVITQMVHNITLEGVRQGKLLADSAFFYRDEEVYDLVDPTLDIYTEESGTPRAHVTSERGRYNPNTREMLAEGNVVLLITDGDKRIETEELHYDPRADRIWSDSATTLIEPGRISEGLGFESDMEFRRTVVGPGSIRNTGGGGGAPD